MAHPDEEQASTSTDPTYFDYLTPYDSFCTFKLQCKDGTLYVDPSQLYRISAPLKLYTLNEEGKFGGHVEKTIELLDVDVEELQMFLQTAAPMDCPRPIRDENIYSIVKLGLLFRANDLLTMVFETLEDHANVKYPEGRQQIMLSTETCKDLFIIMHRSLVDKKAFELVAANAYNIDEIELMEDSAFSSMPHLLCKLLCEIKMNEPKVRYFYGRQSSAPCEAAPSFAGIEFAHGNPYLNYNVPTSSGGQVFINKEVWASVIPEQPEPFFQRNFNYYKFLTILETVHPVPGYAARPININTVLTILEVAIELDIQKLLLQCAAFLRRLYIEPELLPPISPMLTDFKLNLLKYIWISREKIQDFDINNGGICSTLAFALCRIDCRLTMTDYEEYGIFNNLPVAFTEQFFDQNFMVVHSPASYEYWQNVGDISFYEMLKQMVNNDMSLVEIFNVFCEISDTTFYIVCAEFWTAPIDDLHHVDIHYRKDGKTWMIINNDRLENDNEQYEKPLEQPDRCIESINNLMNITLPVAHFYANAFLILRNTGIIMLDDCYWLIFKAKDVEWLFTDFAIQSFELHLFDSPDTYYFFSTSFIG